MAISQLGKAILRIMRMDLPDPGPVTTDATTIRLLHFIGP